MPLTLAWVEREIEECLNGDNTAKNVTDYAILCIARENLKSLQEIKPVSEQKQGKDTQPRQRVVLSNYCADLNTIPCVEEIGAAIEAAASAAYDPEEKNTIQDMRTWNDILKRHAKN